MIYVRKEGELIRNGFNFYPWSDRFNTGFVFRWNNFQLMVRRSTLQQSWVVQTARNTQI